MRSTIGDRAEHSVLVTGGAGFLGINLARHLLARGYSVTSVDIEPFGYPERSSIREVRADIRDYPSLEQAMRGASVVIHCAAALPSYPLDAIMSTEVEGTRNVLRAALANGIPRVVHLSSTAIYGARVVDTPEDAPVQLLGPYAEAKVLAEQECLEARRQGLIVPILRPKTFVGPERLGIWAMLYDWAYSGSGFPLIGAGDNRYQLLDVEDLCEVIHTTMTAPSEVVNDVFNVGASDFGTMREDFQAVLDHAGHGRRVRPLPVWPVTTTLKLLEALRLSPLYAWVYETAAADSYVSIAKAESALGFRPRYSNIQALIRNYDWYVEHLPDIQRQTGVSHRAAWKQGLVGLGKHFF
jgi:nucleoside-diphosphate-sugar epimerase